MAREVKRERWSEDSSGVYGLLSLEYAEERGKSNGGACLCTIPELYIIGGTRTRTVKGWMPLVKGRKKEGKTWKSETARGRNTNIITVRCFYVTEKHTHPTSTIVITCVQGLAIFDSMASRNAIGGCPCIYASLLPT